ncbi:hypothetical protein [Myxococcus landrumensis]|uniref:Lipoprotein n=1 Tax=Myxococcus landrumensis TaxID=2813577 RepID=A0ABX7N0A7_9BACT|nr:hypothetical protein [Myxococcus landrumus]QSQ12125.1 hypothetical protein JY572_27635 [Myxococcus landrumus]
MTHMVGKLAWMALVVAGLSVMLCAGGCSAKAQSKDAEPAVAPKSNSTPSAQTTPAEMSELWNSVSGLRAEVLQLRKEVASLRAQVKDSERSQQPAATGGSGAQGTSSQETGGVSAQQATGGASAQGSSSQRTSGASAQGTSSQTAGVAGAQGTSSQATGGASAQGTSSQEQATRGSDTGTGGAGAQSPAAEAPQSTGGSGRARVTATYRGTVRSVIPPEVVIAQEDGSALTLEVGSRTLVVGTTGKRIDVRDLGPGDRVRAVVDMVGQHETVEISVLRKEDAGE